MHTKSIWLVAICSLIGVMTGMGVVTFLSRRSEEVRAAVSDSKIVFTSDRDRNKEIYVMNADGTGQTRLTFNTSRDEHPALSPDGSPKPWTSLPGIYVFNYSSHPQGNRSNNY